MTLRLYDRLLTVTDTIEETPETKSLKLDWAGQAMEFVPGQFVIVTVQLPNRGRVRRAYSVASSPLDPELLLTVKRMENGLLSTFLCDNVQPGDRLHIRGPYGRFTLEQNAKELVFIAAGSGIVPFRSMWRYIRQTGSKTEFSLLYASKCFRYVIYRDELAGLTQAGYRIVHTLTRTDDPLWSGYSRRIDREMLDQFVGDFADKLFYVCGPPDFCNRIAAWLVELTVSCDRIKTEKYD
jgi:ferredoxin-NADP reductase